MFWIVLKWWSAAIALIAVVVALFGYLGGARDDPKRPGIG